ncbi:hypothetical protein [Nonomuraea rubra]
MVVDRAPVAGQQEEEMRELNQAGLRVASRAVIEGPGARRT